jgi:hypothetical protein
MRDIADVIFPYPDRDLATILVLERGFIAGLLGRPPRTRIFSGECTVWHESLGKVVDGRIAMRRAPTHWEWYLADVWESAMEDRRLAAVRP